MGRLFGRKTIFLVLILGIAVFYNANRVLPVGISTRSSTAEVTPSSVVFLKDTTYVDESGVRHSEQEIFDTALSLIQGAEKYILLDMFLYNDFQGENPETYRALSSELTDALLLKKTAYPDMPIYVVSDPINMIYGGYISPHFEELEAAGIDVVITDLTQLRDSNPLYASFWRLFVQWFGNSTEGRLPNPFIAHGPGVSLRSYLSLLNFKANHRKVLVVDYPHQDRESWATLITSANPHDGSSAHENVGILVFGDSTAEAVLKSEQAVGDFSGKEIILPDFNDSEVSQGDVSVTVVTEEKIRDAVLYAINTTQPDDRIDLVMFYLADREVVRALKDALGRGVSVRLVLDPNKDAFGRKKNGVPNRPVASELTNAHNGAQVRWCDTHGEQCHSKLIIVQSKDTYTLILGSANMTRRNIGDFNLETNIVVESEGLIPAISEAYDYIETIWNNEDGNIYTSDYHTYADERKIMYGLYRVMEASGLSSF